MTKRIVNLRR